MAFVRASKKQAKLRLALIGVSGSGKTYSSLAVATQLAARDGGRVAVIDTEHGSASKYGSGKPFDFDVLELSDYNPQNYIDAIREAEQAGYAVVVLDSLSHAWTGRGGALEMKDNASRRQGNNSFTAWRDVTPLHNALIDAMLQSRCHVIATMRAKQEHVVEKDERGKTTIRKVGIGAVQRDGMEYEFDVVGDLDQENVLTVTKTRCPELSGKCVRQPGVEFAQVLMTWLSDGAPPTLSAAPPPAAPLPQAAPAAVATGDALSPGVDPTAMSGVKPDPVTAKVMSGAVPVLQPALVAEKVRGAWERLKAERGEAAAKETWKTTAARVIGEGRPSSTWSAEELARVTAELWPANAAPEGQAVAHG